MNEPIQPIGKIFSAIPAIIAEVGAVGKNMTNQQQRYKYRSADDVCDAIRPLMGKHGVFPTKYIAEHVEAERESKGGGRLAWVKMKCIWTFYATDGSSVTTESFGEGMDSFDKATNKAETASMKNALIQVFQLMGHEDSEANDPPNLEYDQDRRERWPRGNDQPSKPNCPKCHKHAPVVGQDGAWHCAESANGCGYSWNPAEIPGLPPGVTTADKLLPPAEKSAYDLACETIADAQRKGDLKLLKKIEERVMQRHREGLIAEGDYLDLGSKIADAEEAIKAVGV